MLAKESKKEVGAIDGGARQSPQVIGAARKEDDMHQPAIPQVLPTLPVRGLVVFPHTVVPLTVRRPVSQKLLDEALPQSKVIGLVAQRNDQDNPTPDDLYKVGVAVNVLKLLRQPDGSVIIVVQGLRRIAIRKIVSTEPYIRAEVEVLESAGPPKEDKEWEAAVKNLRETATKLVETMPEPPEQVRPLIEGMEDPGRLADFLASNLNLELAQKQYLVEELDLVKRVRTVQLRVSSQLEIAQLQQKLQQDVASQFSDAQRRAYLREQIKAIQRELGEKPEGADEQIEELRKRLEESKPPPGGNGAGRTRVKTVAVNSAGKSGGFSCGKPSGNHCRSALGRKE
jgi:ATP-dependent Lon protease